MPLQPINVSEELASQHFFKKLIADLLIKLGRLNWWYKCNEHQLTIKPWAVGVWVKEAGTIISYRELAIHLEDVAICKAMQLGVKRLGERIYIVKSFQRGHYAVRRSHNNQLVLSLIHI